jgi:hypothetical protein
LFPLRHLRAVEEDPSREIVGKVEEAMFLACRNEQNIARTERNILSLAVEAARSTRDHIDFVARVWMLGVSLPRRI